MPITDFTYIVAIDPGTNTAVAALGRVTKRLIHTEVTDFFGCQDLVSTMFGNDKASTLIFVEQPPNFTYAGNRGTDDKAIGGDRMAMASGGNRREAQLIAEAFRRSGWTVEQVPPVNKKKWTQEQFQLAMKTKQKATEHERDAARLALYYLDKRLKKEKG